MRSTAHKSPPPRLTTLPGILSLGPRSGMERTRAGLFKLKKRLTMASGMLWGGWTQLLLGQHSLGAFNITAPYIWRRTEWMVRNASWRVSPGWVISPFAYEHQISDLNFFYLVRFFIISVSIWLINDLHLECLSLFSSICIMKDYIHQVYLTILKLHMIRIHQVWRL